MTIKQTSTTLISLLLVMNSCMSTKLISQKLDQYLEKDLKLNYFINSIEVYDHRDSISNEDIKLPFISHPKQKITNITPLDGTHISIIKNTLKERSTTTGNPARINVNIVKAYKEFSATFWNEKERVFVELQLDMIDQSNNISVLCSSHAEYNYTSGDAKHKRIEMFYQKAFKGALIDCLSKVENDNKVPYKNQ